MKNKLSWILVLNIALILVAILVWKGVKNSQTPQSLDMFADCLTGEKGAVFYGTESCSWCQKEKAGFKKSWQFINYVNCTQDPNGCLALGIEATPTWIFGDGKRLIGYQGLDKLAEESNCPLPELGKI